MKTVLIDFKRAVSGWGFWAAVIGTVAVLLIGSAQSVLNAVQFGSNAIYIGYSVSAVKAALTSDALVFAVPILCAFCYTSAFVDDYKTGYLKFYLSRSNRKSYIAGKVTSCAVSGGLALIIGIAIIWIIYTVIFLPMETAPPMANPPPGAPDPADVMRQMAGLTFRDSLFRSGIIFLSGCLWSLVGAVFAVMTMGKYIGYCSPFIFYYVLVIIGERYLMRFIYVNPQQWINPTLQQWVNITPKPGELQSYNAGYIYVALLVAALIAVFCAALSFGISRRLKNV